MKKIFYIYGLFLLTTCLPAIPLQAQVTIGKDVVAAPYSLLQIEYDETKFPNGAGVQLPRLTTVDKIILEAQMGDDPQAIGLTIYNIDTKKVECWDGAKWIVMPIEFQPTYAGTNGLSHQKTGYTTTVGLGGNLTENTSISLQDQTLNFTQQAGALFGVENNTGGFFVKDNKVGVGTDNPTAKLHIHRTLPNGLRIVDGNQGINKVWTLKNNENAQWDDLPEVINVDKTFLNSPFSVSFNTDVQVGNTVTCERGKWLIVGKVNTRTATNVPTGNWYSWAKIKNNGSDVLSVAGVKTETGGERWSMPELIHYQEFLTDNNVVSLWVNVPRTSGTGTATSNPVDYDDNGQSCGGFLFAIKLAD